MIWLISSTHLTWVLVVPVGGVGCALVLCQRLGVESECGGGEFSRGHWWWWDSLVDKGPHCLCWSCWTADEQLGRSPAGRGKVRVGCDKNICICICICICWIDEQDERSTPQSWKKGHKWLAGCDKKSGTLLSPFWWKGPPTITFHLLGVTKNFGVHLLCL